MIISEKLVPIKAETRKNVHLSIVGQPAAPLCGVWAKFGAWKEIARGGNLSLCQECVTRSHELGMSISREEKISMRMRGNQNGLFARKYAVNPNAFGQKIESEGAAYWLGFLMADGCVHADYRSHVLSVRLAAKDISHLQKLKEFLGAEHPIHHSNSGTRNKGNNDYYTLAVPSIELCKNLMRLGVVPRKTYLLEFPSVRGDVIHHFIRGYFDGDGWVTVSPKRVVAFGIIGRRSFLEDLRMFLAHACELEFNRFAKDSRHPDTDTVSLIYGGTAQCRRIYDILYYDASIWLDRKKAIWESVYGAAQ